MKFKDQVAIITGGVGGIGKPIVRAFLAEGAGVAIADVSQKELDQVVKDLKGEGDLVGIAADVSKYDDIHNLAEQTLKYFGSIDILVNSAGIQGPIGPLREADIEEWIHCIHVNLIGTVVCCRAILPIMVSKKRGKVINFAGGGANYSRPNFSAYAISKTGIVRLTEILADELKSFNIQVNAVSPGVIKTKMIDEILEAGREKAGYEYDQLRAKFLKGFDSPDLVAELVCFLASHDSDWITGKTISAVWDPWKEWQEKGQTELDKDLYVLRRIDYRNFIKKKK